jgi:predicted secreted protein with PEFG-CTERM motif
LNKVLVSGLTVFALSSVFYPSEMGYANPFFSNGYFTENGIEWCEENLPLYEILQEKFFEHHKHSLESRVCASLYQDYYWTYDGPDRVEKLIERSKHYSQLEISESYEESETGIIDTTPAENKDQTLLRGMTEDGELNIQIISSAPTINESMEINLAFLDKDNRLQTKVNYGIEITQQEQAILSNSNLYSEKGLSTMNTRPLNSDEPVTIAISINGIGIPENETSWTGPKREVIIFTVVPEFGEIAIIIFSITIVGILLLNFKSRTLFSTQSSF